MDSTGSAYTPLIFLFTFMLLLYFMSIRPQQKRAKELQNMMDSLEKGDEVIAASGILGKVKEIKGDYVAIEVSENITFKLQRNAISNVLPKDTSSASTTFLICSFLSLNSGNGSPKTSTRMSTN